MFYDDRISALKWADGIAAVFLSLLWATRQMLLTLMYNGAFLAHAVSLFYANVIISAILLVGAMVFILITAVLSAFRDTVYSNTLVVFVGFVVSIALDKRRQFNICYRTRRISHMLAKDKFRVGRLTLDNLTNENRDEDVGIFRISKRRRSKYSITKGVKWSGLKYEETGLFYIEDWGIEHRIYGMDPENLAKHMGKYGLWVDALLEASLSVGWLPSHYINSNLLRYLEDYASSSKSIKDSIPTWKGQAVGLQGVSSLSGDDALSKKILGYYALAIIEEPGTAKQWIKNWCKKLEKRHKEGYRYKANDVIGDIRDLETEDVQSLHSANLP